ncbi:CaiB/BaiF CoA-transferase family protein [Hydrogenophaga sp.]|uniref:CaiB/BaiF CoA transferase family protein n=1 Tax=Hydrogenophaga sp. TaxID=1904254 RepID=UPI00271B7567|nr:CaiB/BaiF CoA-transferase family protein [Hydrogenophaga sp.]MDO9435384.1 CaiB/BaiF CoA-transferase family protein [Hydrogenophaga sp.]
MTEPASGRPGALGHVRVLDLTRVLAGPWCTQTLADLGADVVKVERPVTGDDTRQWGPPFAMDERGVPTSEAAYFMAVNRNKRSIAIDFSTPAGSALVRRLALESDVVVENYKVGQLAEYGLDHASLRALKPDLVYCSVTGFGQSGPYAARAGYDFIVQGLGGFMSITGERDDLAGGGPQKAGVAVADLFTGAHAVIGILAALTHRDRTGEGQHIDVALLDVQVAMMANMATNYLATGTAPKRWGNAHPNIVPYQTFEAADGWIIVAAGNDSQFRKFVDAGQRPELAADERFATNPKRVENRDALVPELQAMAKTMSRDEWIRLLETRGVPCGPINDLEDVFRDPQVLARDMMVEMTHSTAGRIRLPGSALKMGGTPVHYSKAPPLLGEHEEEVLRDWLGQGG